MSRQKALLLACPILILLMLIGLGVPGTVYAQKQVPAHQNVLVRFQDGQVQAPIDKTSAPTMQWSFRSGEVTSLLGRYQVENVAKTFPGFNKADTLGVASRTKKPVKLIDMSEVYTMTLPGDADAEAFAVALSKADGVLYAEMDGTVRHWAPIIPNDPSFPLQWGLNNTGQNGGTVDADVDAPEAWEISTGTTNEVIGIIDGGVEGTHADLLNKVTGDAGWGWAGHGFHVAGIAAANSNNGVGVAGMDWSAQIVSQRIDNAASDAETYSAIMDAVNAGADVLNNSWSLTTTSGAPRNSATVRSAFINAYKLNRISCAAMANTGQPAVFYPAGFGQGIIAVGATDGADHYATYSTTGSHIDVCAPGSAIYSTVPYGNGYDYMTGTSMATPHVSGLAALMLSVNPSLYNDDVEALIRKSADDITAYPATVGFDNYTGAGRINARRALDYLRPPYTIYAQTASGGASVGSSSPKVTFFGVPGLADGQYFTNRYEVRKAVTFPTFFTSTPTVWARGLTTSGFNIENPNYALPWCEIVPGTLTSTGCTFRTYVYEVFDGQGRRIGWFPNTIAGATFGYALHGPVAPLTVDIAGPTSLGTGQGGTWTATVTGGNNVYAYQWYYRANAFDSWTPVGNGSSYARTMVSADFQLMLQVTSVGQTAADIQCVAWSGGRVVTISGPRAIWQGMNGTFTANVTGSAPICVPLTYAWQYRMPPGQGAWSAVIGTNPTLVYTMPTEGDVELQCTVTGASAAADTHYVDAPPMAVGNLDASTFQFGATLFWTAPGDDGNTGQVAAYDLRYSTTLLTAGNFESATPIPTYPPQPAGSAECADISSLSSCSPYYFAIRSLDQSGNWSMVSNIVNQPTKCRPGPWMICDLGGALNSRQQQLVVDMPKQVELGIPSPQPIRGRASLRYGVPMDQDGQHLNLSLYDVLGRRVRQYVDGPAIAGRHDMSLPAYSDEGAPLSKGVYFMRLTVGSKTLSRSVVVLE